MNSETIKVLLIDDDEDDYIITRELFSLVKAGDYQLDWASSYEEGLKVLGRREHQVCVLDYCLGERSGVQLVREARETQLLTPMIILTGQGDHDVDVEAMRAGATDYLVKGETSPSRLERTIRYAVQLNAERCRSEQELAAYAQKQAAVAEIGHLALIGVELNHLLAETVAVVARTLGVEYCKVLEVLPEPNSALILRAGVGWKKEYQVGEATLRINKKSQAEFALLTNEPVLVEDLRTETRFSSQPMLHDHGVVSGMSVIIRGRDRPYGVLGAHTTSLRRFATDDVNFLVAVANVLAEAIGRQRADDEIRQSEARFRSVVESKVLGIFSACFGGEIFEANDTFLKMVGYTREDLAAGRLRWREMTPPQYQDLDDHAYAELMSSGVCEAFEKEYICKDGSRIAVLISGAILEGSENRGVAFVLDISDRKRAEESLRQSESQFRALFEKNLDALLIANDEGVYVDANPAAGTLLGISCDEVIGRSVGDFSEENFRKDAPKHWAQFLKEGMMRGEFQLRRPDGKVIEVESSAIANFIPGRHLGMVRDITERRRLEEQLRLSQRLESVGMLAGGIAHDFNNFLTVITGYSELSLTRLDKNDPVAQNTEEVKKAAEKATCLTRQLLAFSRKQLLQPKVLDLNSIIVDIQKILLRLVGEDMDLRTMPADGLGQVKADPGQIEQVIINLTVNARDAMPSGGKITIETANVYLDDKYAREHIAVKPGWYVMLAVTDTGHGMDAKTQKSIFEPFFTTKAPGKGTGLGLATVYGIVKQSDGNIWVYSEPGVGTSFKIYLPLVHESVTAFDAESARPERTAGTATILLAEDEEMVRNLVRDSLEMDGYTMLEATNGQEALLLCQEHEGPIHLLLTDVVMPGMSGRELADQLAKLRPEVRVLYMSGYTDQAIVHHGILDGDINFIGKPFTPSALALKVASVLQHVSRLDV